MVISFWKCEYARCEDYDDEYGSRVYIYNCSHPLNRDKYCHLDNKWGSDRENCTLLDTEICSCP